MVSKLRSWWKNTNKKLDAVIILMLVVLLALIVISILGYAYNWSWSGLHGKTFWDWLQLLIIPAVLAVGGYLFNYTTGRTEREAAAKRDQTERDISLDNQREAALQAYINSMSELLLEKKLRESGENDEVRTIARVRTITILFQLDARRIGFVFAFLREAGLMSNKPDSSIVSLSQADLRVINLSKANLKEANLKEANLSGADLRHANLYQANLSGANLNEAILLGADLSKAILIEANFSKAILAKANLSGAILWRVNLSEAELMEADLSKANLAGANLSKANLTWADLSKAMITEEQLKQVKSLKGATMPDGTPHD